MSDFVGKIWIRSHESGPTIQAARNFRAWIKYELIVTASSCNTAIKGSIPTEGHYFILWSDSVYFKSTLFFAWFLFLQN